MSRTRRLNETNLHSTLHLSDHRKRAAGGQDGELQVLMSVGSAIAYPFKWFWFTATLKLKLVIIGLIVLIGLGFYAKSCWSARKVRLSERQIQEAKIAIEERNDEKLKEVFAKADAEQAVIDQTVANSEADVKKAEAEAKKKYENMSNEELAKELERRLSE